MRSKLSNGFTLIELLIVIVVIAVLAAISIVAYNGINARAQNAAMHSNLKHAAGIAQKYYIDNNESYYVNGSNNICTSPEMVKLVSSIQSQDMGSACLASADGEWAVSAVKTGMYYTVDSKGVAQFDALDGSATTWDNGMLACQNAGKRLPTGSQMRTLDTAYYDKYSVRPVPGFQTVNVYWTSTEYPSNLTYSYYLNFGNGVYAPSPKTSARQVRCIGS